MDPERVHASGSLGKGGRQLPSEVREGEKISWKTERLEELRVLEFRAGEHEILSVLGPTL